MLFLLIACAAAVYLWHHAPALLLLLGAVYGFCYIVIPLCGWIRSATAGSRIFNAPYKPKPQRPSGPLVMRSDLVAVPVLLSLAGTVIWLCSMAPR